LLLGKEMRALVASQSFWLLLLVVGLLVGHAFITSVNLYAEASGIGGGPAALAQGLNPLEGIVVPTFGAYDIAATLLLPFVAIRLVASEKQSGELALTLQAPTSFSTAMTAKVIALLLAWIVTGAAGGLALAAWYRIGGHLSPPETLTVVLGHVLRGMLAIGIGAAAGALAASAASAAIVALTITIGTWALDYVAAARGGIIAKVAEYTPSAALRVFEHGELRVSTILIVATLALTGFAIATIWLREGRPVAQRVRRVAASIVVAASLCVGFGRIRYSWDESESRRNSFSAIDDEFLRSIREPLLVTVNLAAEDPRLADLERGVLSKLQRTMRDVQVEYIASGRSGLFERSGDHYGEVWYQLDTGENRRAAMTRSTTEAIVLETLYSLEDTARPASADGVAYSGYPLPQRAPLAPWAFFVAWPVIVLGLWWRIRRPTAVRSSPIDSSI
jgi:ABC-2 type transport system permease protein